MFLWRHQASILGGGGGGGVALDPQVNKFEQVFSEYHQISVMGKGGIGAQSCVRGWGWKGGGGGGVWH